MQCYRMTGQCICYQTEHLVDKIRILLPSITNAVGSILLILIGIAIMKDFFQKKNSPKTQVEKKSSLTNCGQILRDPEKADRNRSGTNDLKEYLILALALTINNFGLGIGPSITGLNIYVTVIFTFSFSIVSISLGCILVRSWLSSILGKYVLLASGMI